MKTLVATCECPDYTYRAGRDITPRELAQRWNDAHRLRVLDVKETAGGVWQYEIKTSGSEKEPYTVLVSNGNGDRIDWPCKHCLRAIAEEMRRLHGLRVIFFMLSGDEDLWVDPGEFFEIGSGLVAVVEKEEV